MIRSATAGDRPAILDLVRAAFPNDGREEVPIVEATWRRRAALVELVAVTEDDGAVVGHVLAARARVGVHDAVGLAPLAVVPGRQGEGIGSALVGELLARLDAAGEPFVALLGNPAYYGRFGFEHAGRLGVVYEAVGADSPHFQLRRLAAYDPAIRGPFVYCWEA